MCVCLDVCVCVCVKAVKGSFTAYSKVNRRRREITSGGEKWNTYSKKAEGGVVLGETGLERGR